MNKNTNYNLKAEIIKNFGSQLAFTIKIGSSELFVSQVITGRRKLTIEKQKEWAKLLKCKPQEIFSN